jgi:hypothetical protein
MKWPGMDIPLVVRAALSVIPVVVLVRVTPLLYDYWMLLLHPPVRRYYSYGWPFFSFLGPGFVIFTELFSAIGLFVIWRGVTFSRRNEP